MAEESSTRLYPLPHAQFRQLIQVKLQSGAIVERDPSDLVELPPDLAVPLEDLDPPAA